MKSLVAVVVALGAAVAFTPSASAASTVYLSSNMEPVTISVNGKGVSVNGGYDATPVSTSSNRVSLSAPARVSLGGGVCGTFSGWSDGNGSRSRTVDLNRNAYYQVYYNRASC